MTRIMAAALLAVLLAACAPSAEELAAADHELCTDMGVARGTPEYSNCRLAAMQDRTLRRALLSPAQRWGAFE
jgi:hypothetical protein